MNLIAQGAEAKLYKEEDTLVKDRIKKSYRIEELDKRIRKFRTKREAKVLGKLNSLGFVPKVIDNDEKQKIVMEFINGETLRDYLTSSNYKELMQELGKKIALIHNKNIIHGDLTTSNFICQKSKISEHAGNSKNFPAFKKEIYFIDFGLSFESHKIEDKAVDLHLLKQALESKHYKIFEKAYKIALKAYEKEADQGSEVIKRLELVEKRGRYKH